MRSDSFESVDNLTRAQELLIRSCLAASKEERERAVRSWEDEVVIEDLDFSSSRLIPYFFYGNQQHGIATRHDNRLKIIYKYWWLRTQHISHELKKVHEAFLDAGVEVIVIKGASIKTHYERDELRPMADFDLVVRPADLRKAVQVLEGLNYLPDQWSANYYQKHFKLLRDCMHAIGCDHQTNGSQLDLHWRVGSQCSTEFANDLWLHLDDYSPIPNARKPQLAYEVFMLVIHAADAENRDNLTWILDIAVIIQTARQPFWEEARKLAIFEKKEDLFDYSCSVLVKLGLDVPDRGIVTKPGGLISTAIEDRQHLSSIKLFRIRVRNIFYRVERLFPHANALGKLYYIARMIYYQYITK